jgi:hypothetical protein
MNLHRFGVDGRFEGGEGIRKRREFVRHRVWMVADSLMGDQFLIEGSDDGKLRGSWQVEDLSFGDLLAEADWGRVSVL